MTTKEKQLILLAETKRKDIQRMQLRKFAEPSAVELGTTGSSIWNGMISEEYQADLRNLVSRLKVYERMRNDSQVMATLLLVELPIRSAVWDVKPAEDSGAKGDEIAAFVHDALLATGAMSITWDDFLRQTLLMFSYGFMLFEIVYKIEQDKILWQKFAPRMPKSVDRWLTDESGGYAGFIQITNEKGSVTIPAEKTLRFTYRQEGSNFEGISFLRWVYKNWWFKDLLYRLSGMAAERTGVGVPMITLPENYTKEDLVQAKAIVTSWRANEEAGAVMPYGYQFEIPQGSAFEYLPLIENHDKQITKGILAQFMNLGQDRVGSYALGETQMGFFLMSLGAIVRYIEDTINTYAVKRLVDMNFQTDQYPSLFGTLPRIDTENLSKALSNLISGQLITPDTDLEDHLRDLLDLPPRSDVTSASEHFHFAEAGTNWKPTPFWRPLNQWEDRKSLKLLNDNWNQLEMDFQKGIEGIIDKQRDDILKQINRALEKASFRDLLSIAPRYGEELRQYIKAAFITAADLSRQGVADEMGLRVQELSTKIQQWMNARSELTAERIQEDMRWEVTRKIFNRKELVSEISEGAVGAQTMKQIAREAFEAIEDYKSKSLTMVGRAVIGEGIRTGRDTIIEHPDVTLAMRSEILDGNTCANCARLDGYTTQFNSENYAKYSPPQFCFGGNNCRGIWIYITKDETPQPDITTSQPRLEETVFSEWFSSGGNTSKIT